MTSNPESSSDLPRVSDTTSFKGRSGRSNEINYYDSDEPQNQNIENEILSNMHYRDNKTSSRDSGIRYKEQTIKPSDAPSTGAGFTTRKLSPAVLLKIHNIIIELERAFICELLTGSSANEFILFKNFREFFKILGEQGKHFLADILNYYNSKGGAPSPIDTKNKIFGMTLSTIRFIYDVIVSFNSQTYSNKMLKSLMIRAGDVRAGLHHLRRAIEWGLHSEPQTEREFPEIALRPIISEWGGVLSPEMSEKVLVLGAETFRNTLSTQESVAVVGNFIGSNDFASLLEPSEHMKFLEEFFNLTIQIALHRNAVLTEIDERGFKAFFPFGVRVGEHPLKASFYFGKQVINATRKVCEKWVRRLLYQPSAKSTKSYGLAVGLDIGIVEYLPLKGRIITAGETVLIAEQCSHTETGKIIANNSLRWRINDEKKDSSSPIYFENYPVLFKEVKMNRLGGGYYRAYEVLGDPENDEYVSEEEIAQSND